MAAGLGAGEVGIGLETVAPLAMAAFCSADVLSGAGGAGDAAVVVVVDDDAAALPALFLASPLKGASVLPSA